MESKFIKNLAKAIIALAIIVGAIFIFSIFSNAEDGEIESKKNEEEIEYLDNKILSLINYLNNIDMQNYKIVLTKIDTESSSSSSSSQSEGESSNKQEETSGEENNKEEQELSKMEEETIVTDEEEIDWDTIEGEIELLSATWPTIVIDLYSQNINSEYILGFSDDLNETIINIKNKDKTMSCMYLAKLYSYLPQFLDKDQTDDVKEKTIQTKSYIINAYAYAETENWDKMEEEILKAESIFTALVNDVEYVNDQRKYNINKGYIVIEELKKSLTTEDVGIFYIKYKSAIEQLNFLE